MVANPDRPRSDELLAAMVSRTELLLCRTNLMTFPGVMWYFPAVKRWRAQRYRVQTTSCDGINRCSG